MHHEKLPLSLFFGVISRWSRRTLGVPFGAALALSSLAHASEGANEAPGKQLALENMPEAEFDGSEPSSEGLEASNDIPGGNLGNGKELPNTPEAIRGVLQIRSEPSGALITVDGKRVGPTPLDHVTSIGHHRVELLRPGYQLHAEDVVVGVEPGEPIIAKLERVPPQAQYKTPRWRLITVGSILGSGLGLSIGGGTLLFIHDRPPRRHCREYASELDCPFRYNTNVPGGILLGIGLLHIVVGNIFIMYTNQYNRTQRQLQNQPVRIRPTATGMSIAF